MKDLSAKINLLIKKADLAQKNGNYAAMDEYDKMIQLLREEEFANMQQMYNESYQNVSVRSR